MSHFPCLEKDYIQGVLNPHDSQLPENWRGYLNSEILDKYLEIKRNQKQKIAEILPRYHIFPKNFNTYNIYTHQYELDRLQRIKNSSNVKYANNQKSRPKKSNSQQPDDMVFMRSASQVFGGNSSMNRPSWEEENRSGLRFNESKSTKSLTETQISPSKLSKNFNHRNPSKLINQSDSQLSGQRNQFFRQTHKQGDKSWTSNARSHKNPKNHRDNQKLFSNVQSAITVVKRQKNGGRNQENQDYYYDPERGYDDGNGNGRLVINDRDLSARKSERSPKSRNLLYYHCQNEYEIGKGNKRREEGRQESKRDDHYGWNAQRLIHPEQVKRNYDDNQNQSNYYIESPFNPRYQQSQIQGNKMVGQNRNEHHSRISESRQQNGFQGKSKGIKSQITINQANAQYLSKQKGSKHQKQAHNSSSQSNSISIDQAQQNPTKQSRYSHSRSNSNNRSPNNQQQRYFDPRNTFSKNATIDNETQISNIQDKLLEYYGDEFQRIKAERDYLRKHFIEHLEKHHSDKLPYKQLTQIKVDQTGKKLIISQKAVPVSKQEKDNQVFYAEVVQYGDKKRKK